MTNLQQIMFQRLRQMVAHIFMAQEVMEKEYTVYDVDEMLKTFGKSHELDSLEMKMLTSMRGMIEAKGEVPEETQEADIVPPPEENPKSLKVGKSGTLTARFGTFLRQLKNKSKWGELKERTCCQKCGAPPEEPLVMNCLHVYCKECLEHMAYEAAAHDMDETACAKCGTAYTECQSCDGLKELEYPDLSASMFQKPDGAQPEKKYKLTMNWVDSDNELLLSTKLIAVKEQLEKWVVESPDTKIIVFTEWHMVYVINRASIYLELTIGSMHILGRICQQKKWKCCHVSRDLNRRLDCQLANLS